MPLNEQGYTYPRLVEVIEDLKTRAGELFKDLVPEGDVVNVGDNSALGRQIGLLAPAVADVWEASQQVYDAFNINAATGVALDNLTALGGVARDPASSTITTVTLTGSVGTEIPAGEKVTDVRTGNFHTLLSATVLDNTSVTKAVVSVLTVADSTAYTVSYQRNPDSLAAGIIPVTITSGIGATAATILAALAAEINLTHSAVITAEVIGASLYISTLAYTSKVDVTVTSNLNVDKVTKVATIACDVTGPVEIPLNSVTRISVPILGWDSVTNPATGITGTNRETDSELRARYKVAKFGDGSNLTESLYSALYGLDGVESVAIIENETDIALTSPDPLVPPHSFYVVVLGGESQQIAQAIWNNKPLGIGTFGSLSATVYDSQGIPKVILFDRPTAVDIYITAQITVQDNFAPDGVAQLKAALLAHVNSLLINDDVVYSRLYSPLNSVAGHYVNSLTLGIAPLPVGTSNVTIQYFEKALLTEANIIITTV